LLERQAGLQVVGEAADSDELLAAIADCDQARPTGVSVKFRHLCESRQTPVRRSAEQGKQEVIE